MDSNGSGRSPETPTQFPDLVLAAQWGALRAWVDVVPVAVLARPSILPGWSIDELLSHLATSVDTISQLRPEPSDPVVEEPLPLLDYLTRYQARSAFIQERSISAAAARADRRGELDEAWARAGRALVALGSGEIVVRAPGGPIELADFLLTRLVELVVHGLDLVMSVRASAGRSVVGPLVLPAALRTVAGLIRTLCEQKASHRSSVATADRPGPDDASIELFPDGLDDVRLVLLGAGRDLDHDGLSTELRAVLPLF